MGEAMHDRSPDTSRNRSATDERVAEPRSVADEWLGKDRSATDESLQEERSTADELLDDEQRVVEVLDERRADAQKVLREVRAKSDVRLEQKAEALPEIAETLPEIAEALPEISAKLGRVAEDLKGTAESADVVASNCAAEVATLTEQLAEIAEGVAEITSTLADERHDADEILRQERRATDGLIEQQLNAVESTLTRELREERQELQQERQATDEDLATEREHTDEAVEHVQGLLVEERRHHAHAARGVATRNEFLGIVSHDLRGPLMTIAGVAALLDQQAPNDELGQRMHAWADRVRRSVNVMERLIGDLLDVNSFEDGQLRVVAERLDLRPLIHGAIDAFQSVAQAEGVSLEADLPAEPLMAKHDPHRLFQVLSNLIHNAIKFTPAGGHIRVRAERAGRFYQVSVSDTGVGIPDGDLTGIFERFRQLNHLSHRTGLGLGLYISKWIVEAHGGRIWAESKVGDGTTVRFTLPEERRSS